MKDIIKEFKKEDILSQTILLNWLRNWTDLYDRNLEAKFNKILEEFVCDILIEKLALQKKELLEKIDEALTPHEFVSDNPKIEKVIQDEKLKILNILKKQLT